MGEASARGRRLITLATGAAAVLTVTCSRCDPGSVPSTPNIRTDAGGRDQRSPDVSLPGEDANGTDASASDWPGWNRVDLHGLGCPIDVASDAKAAVPVINWIPCTDGRANCEEIDGTAFSTETIKFPNGWFSLDARAFVLVHFVKGNLIAEFDVFDTKTLAPLAAWRVDYTNAAGVYCDLHPDFTESRMGVLYSSSLDGGPIVRDIDINTPTGLMIAPSLSTLQVTGDGTASFKISDTVFGFDMGLTNSYVRGKTGSSTTVRTKWPYQLTAPTIVVRDDVYAVNQHGTGDGWYREARVDGDGAVMVFREASQRHVTAMATDGSDWYWSESYGTGNPNDVIQPNVEIFTAQYTNNPTTLEATKKKIATLPPGGPPFESVASPGHYIVQAISGQSDILRASDGHRISVVNQGTGWCATPLYATDGEFWCIESLGENGPNGVKVTRLHLGPW